MKRIAVHVDLDGTVFKQYDEDFTDMLKRTPEILPGVRKLFNELSREDHLIILTTARAESSRQRTEEQLREVGLFWHKILFDYPNAPRGIINDIHPKDPNTMRAFAINVNRNEGVEKVDIELAMEAQVIAYKEYQRLYKEKYGE